MNKSKVNERSVWYLRMPLILIAFLACMNAWIYTYDIKMGIAVSGFVVLYSIIAIIMYFYCNSKRIQDMVLFAADFAQVQKQLIKYLELPYGLMDRT
ncbi:MAG: hypothetical protein K2M60_11370, partial [Lachnospiraceae bacterium]|nr:hypothetical protein [Lachnospiraceae bacterium]